VAISRCWHCGVPANQIETAAALGVGTVGDDALSAYKHVGLIRCVQIRTGVSFPPDTVACLRCLEGQLWGMRTPSRGQG
jgi:hypothetical protein